MLNDKRIKACISRFSSVRAYTRMQFLSAVRHSMGAHTETLRPADDSSSSSSYELDEAQTPTASAPTATATTSSASAVTESQFCEVCLIAPREGFALVPCGHARFCENCAMRVAEMNAG